MAASPTQRSLKFLRDLGWTAEVVERYNPAIKTKHDLFGFADILAIRPGHRPLLVQTTSASNFAARRKKILSLPLAAHALSCGFDIILHGWRKPKHRWVVKEEVVTIEDFDHVD